MVSRTGLLSTGTAAPRNRFMAGREWQTGQLALCGTRSAFPLFSRNSFFNEHDGNIVAYGIHHFAGGAGKAVLFRNHCHRPLALGAGQYFKQFGINRHYVSPMEQVCPPRPPDKAAGSAGKHTRMARFAQAEYSVPPADLTVRHCTTYSFNDTATHNHGCPMTRTYIDLHTHSTSSDGGDSPSELISLARKAGVTTLALTDHDTIDGVEEAMEAGRTLGVNVIPGCELSVATEHGELHLVGLWTSPDATRLKQAMHDLQEHRTTRNLHIVQKLQALDIPITYEEVLQIAGTGSVGRPHIARVLMDKGYVRSMYHAFEVYLGDKGLAHVPKKVLSPKEGVALLKEEGATVSIAHMYLHRYPLDWLEDMVATLAGFGMDAIEAYHSEHDARSTRKAVDLAVRHGLALTGGSDYHGAIKPDIRLGRGKGGLYVPPFVLDDLIALRRKQGLPV